MNSILFVSSNVSMFEKQKESDSLLIWVKGYSFFERLLWFGVGSFLYFS